MRKNRFNKRRNLAFLKEGEVGMAAQNWVYVSTDYGRTWTRMEAFVSMTEPNFIGRQRGIMRASEVSISGPGPH